MSAARLSAMIAADPWRMRALAAVAALDLPQGWIGAGFVRTLVWDALAGLARPTPIGDADVIYFDPADPDEAAEKKIEARLTADCPLVFEGQPVPWSVKNQARMHVRNGDAPYRDVADALTHWLETPTAVAVRLNGSSAIEVLAPFGLDDLFGLRIAPTPHARTRRLADYRKRLASKPWAEQWPGLGIDWG
ncbi:MAG: nucleotidyltransferase family protein [Alphaproteobacteria bacterium]|nr:nucleotidyltransferase family protein [Alphaproteobacteria bacterium]